jgi:hypothetical protein
VVQHCWNNKLIEGLWLGSFFPLCVVFCCPCHSFLGPWRCAGAEALVFPVNRFLFSLNRDWIFRAFLSHSSPTYFFLHFAIQFQLAIQGFNGVFFVILS